MKKIILILLLTLGFTSYAQVFEPVKWTTSVEKVSETEYNLVAKASIDRGWHLYSQNVPEDGPIPTSFSFEENEGYSLIGNVEEEEGHTIDDPVFNMVIKFFEDSATFKQKIKITSTELTAIIGEVEFMVCDDSKCLPPTYIDLEFNLVSSAYLYRFRI